MPLPPKTPLEELQMATRSLMDVVVDHPQLHDGGTRQDCRVCQAIERARTALMQVNHAAAVERRQQERPDA